MDEVGHGIQASVLTRAIVKLGQTMRLATIAEGIETAEQRDALRENGCGLGQGNYLAPPLERNAVTELLSVPDTTLPLPAPLTAPAHAPARASARAP